MKNGSRINADKRSLTISKSPCDVDKVKYKYSPRQQSACLHSMQGGCVKGIWPDYLFAYFVRWRPE